MHNNNFENDEAQREKQFRELQIQYERMQRQYNDALAELKMDMDQIEKYLDNRDNFDEETSKAMAEFQKSLDEKYDAVMNQKKDQLKTKNAWENLRDHKPHWIPVR